MNLRFLTPATDNVTGPVARSPMEHAAGLAGARFELRDGWNVAVSYPGDVERAALATAAGWADASHLSELELEGPAESVAAIVADVSGSAPAPLGTATLVAGAWWCPVTPERTMVVGPSGGTAELARRLTDAADADAGFVTVTDVSATLAGLTLAGPGARELIARFCALDLRRTSAPPGSFSPGSVARTPGYVLCEAPDRYLLLFGWAVGHYLWTVVADAGEHLGGHAVGVDALGELDASSVEAPTHA